MIGLVSNGSLSLGRWVWMKKTRFSLLQALVAKHPIGTIYVTWDNADTHQDDEVEAIMHGAAGRLVLLYLPTYRPWLNPIEMLWCRFRRSRTL